MKHLCTHRELCIPFSKAPIEGLVTAEFYGNVPTILYTKILYATVSTRLFFIVRTQYLLTVYILQKKGFMSVYIDVDAVSMTQ